jgi:hypothetical protein
MWQNISSGKKIVCHHLLSEKLQIRSEEGEEGESGREGE